MEFFREPNIDFLGKKWYFLAFSLVFSVAGILSMLFWHGIPLGVDFRGGTLVYVKFSHTPDDNAIRAALEKVGLRQVRIQSVPANNEVLIDLDVRETSEKAGDQCSGGQTGLEQHQLFDISQLPAGKRSPACRN